MGIMRHAFTVTAQRGVMAFLDPKITSNMVKEIKFDNLNITMVFSSFARIFVHFWVPFVFAPPPHTGAATVHLESILIVS